MQIAQQRAQTGQGTLYLGQTMALLLFVTLIPLSAAANDFSFKDTQGKTQRLSDYRGKWVLVNFWATWCAPCLEEMPELDALHQAHKNKDLVVIGIALEYPNPQVVHDFLKEHPVSFPIVLGDYKMAREVGVVEALPTTYLFNPKGKKVSYQSGMVSRASVEEYIRSKK
jgi:thiol-disulfide isomerase/thioredoxin